MQPSVPQRGLNLNRQTADSCEGVCLFLLDPADCRGEGFHTRFRCLSEYSIHVNILRKCLIMPW